MVCRDHVQQQSATHLAVITRQNYQRSMGNILVLMILTRTGCKALRETSQTVQPQAATVKNLPYPGDRYRVVIGSDAVMSINMREWTTTYLVVDATIVVKLAYPLVDVDTGLVLWQYSGRARYSSSAGATDPLVMVVAAAVHAVANAASDGEYERSVARQANLISFHDSKHGLLKGPGHPPFAQDQKRIQEILARENAGSSRR